MRAAALLLLAALAGPATPPWVADVVGDYAGSIRNGGRMECHRTSFALQDGRLVGHYAIDDDDPLEGELVDFHPDSDTSGSFTWIDRYGRGVEYVVFAADRASFAGAWGDSRPDPRNPVRGQRGGSASCERAVSSRQPASRQVQPLG